MVATWVEHKIESHVVNLIDLRGVGVSVGLLIRPRNDRVNAESGSRGHRRQFAEHHESRPVNADLFSSLTAGGVDGVAIIRLTRTARQTHLAGMVTEVIWTTSQQHPKRGDQQQDGGRAKIGMSDADFSRVEIGNTQDSRRV